MGKYIFGIDSYASNIFGVTVTTEREVKLYKNDRGAKSAASRRDDVAYIERTDGTRLINSQGKEFCTSKYYVGC